MWSGFSSEIETQLPYSSSSALCCVACGAASHLRLKHVEAARKVLGSIDVACGAASHLRLKRRASLSYRVSRLSRMWSGFSSEIVTPTVLLNYSLTACVACGAASHLRLKPIENSSSRSIETSRMWRGFSSEIETA